MTYNLAGALYAPQPTFQCLLHSQLSLKVNRLQAPTLFLHCPSHSPRLLCMIRKTTLKSHTLHISIVSVPRYLPRLESQPSALFLFLQAPIPPIIPTVRRHIPCSATVRRSDLAAFVTFHSRSPLLNMPEPVDEKARSEDYDSSHKFSADSRTPIPEVITSLDRSEEKKLLWKLDMHVLPTISILYMLAFIDRINIGNAKIQGLDTDLNMTGNQYNVALFIFFIPYILCEVPSNLLLKRIKPSTWLSFIMLCWGTFRMPISLLAGMC